MAQRGFTFVLDARDATNAFKDLEHGFKRSHRAATEFGNILGGLSSEMGGLGRAFGAVGAALASGSAWGAAAAGVMLIVDHFKEIGKAAEEAKKKAAEEMKKLYDELYELQKESRSKEVELQIAGAEAMISAKKIERAELQRRAEESSAGASLYGPDIAKIDAEIIVLENRARTLGMILGERLNDEITKGLQKAVDGVNTLLDRVTSAEEQAERERLNKPYPGYGLLTGETWFNENYKQWQEDEKARLEMEANLRPMFGPGNQEGEIKFKETIASLEEAGKRFKELWASVGDAVSTSFSAIGSAIGGAAGRIVASLGEIISQVIRLVVVLMSKDVLESGQWWLALPAAAGVLAGLVGILSGVPKYELGGYVPQTGLVMAHAGEYVTPASEVRRGGMGPTVVINANVVDAHWWDQQQGHILRQLSRATRDRRTG